MKKSLAKVAAVAALPTLGASILYVRHGVKVRMRNVGLETLRGVVVHVTGNPYPVGDLSPESSVTTRVVANGYLARASRS